MAKPRWLDRRIAAPGPCLCLCLSAADYAAALRHLGNPANNGWGLKPGFARTETFEGPKGALACLVLVGDVEGRSPIEIAGLLVHEAVHVFQAYCDDLGERRPAVEQQAYGIQAISMELFTEYSRRTA